MKVGIYNFKITGYLLQTSVTASKTFSLDVRHICTTVILSKSADQSVTYREKDPALLINGFSFTENIGLCGAFTYTCTTNLGNPINTAIFTFNSATPSISLQTNLLSDVGLHYLKVIGTLGPWGSAEIQVTVDIQIGCADTTIAPDPISNKIYQVTDAALTFAFIDWTSSVTLCGAFTYSATFADNSALDSSYITFVAATKTFTVSTSNPAHINTYTIKVTGTLAAGAT